MACLCVACATEAVHEVHIGAHDGKIQDSPKDSADEKNISRERRYTFDPFCIRPLKVYELQNCVLYSLGCACLLALSCCVVLSSFRLSVRLVMGPGSVAMLLATGEREKDEILRHTAPANIPQRRCSLGCRCDMFSTSVSYVA